MHFRPCPCLTRSLNPVDARPPVDGGGVGGAEDLCGVVGNHANVERGSAVCMGKQNNTRLREYK